MSGSRPDSNRQRDESKEDARDPRSVLGERSTELYDAHIYARAVHNVNEILQHSGVPLGAHMQASTSRNLDNIERGTGSLPTYHAREVVALSRDAVQAARQGDTTTAIINVSGAGLNTLGFLAGGAREHIAMRAGRSLHAGQRSPTSSSSSTDNSSNTGGCLVM